MIMISQSDRIRKKVYLHIAAFITDRISGKNCQVQRKLICRLKTFLHVPLLKQMSFLKLRHNYDIDRHRDKNCS
jgi:hypothetical protein